MSGGRSAELDGTGYDLVRQYVTTTRSMRMWTELRREVRSALVKLLTDIDTATYRGVPVMTVVRTRPHRFNVAAFAADHPDLFEHYRELPDEDEVRFTPARLPFEEDGDV